MNPAVLALFARALDLDDRNFITYAGRMILVFIIIFLLVSAQAGSAGAPGLQFFSLVGYFTLGFITLAGMVLFGTAISEEKEEQTIGLLKMTGLNPISILLGKGASRVVGALLFLVAQFPFTLLAITLGGVSLSQVFASYVTFASYLVLLGGVGIFASVVCRRSATAIGMTAVLLFLFLFSSLIGNGILSVLVDSKALAATDRLHGFLTGLFDVGLRANPFVRFSDIQQTGFGEAPIGLQALSNVAIGIAFLLVAWVFFERATAGDRSVAPGRSALLVRVRYLRFMGIGRAWRRALIWKEFHFGTGGKVLFFMRFVAVAAVVATVVFFYWRSNGYDRYFWEFLGGTAMVTASVGAGLDLLGQASRTFNSEWRMKTLPALALLPVSTGRLIIEKALGCLIIVIPYSVIFAAGMLCMPSDDLTRVFREFVFTFGFLASLLHTAVFLYLNVYTSLRFKWMGFPVALGIYFGCMPILGLFAVIGMGEPVGAAFFSIVLMLVVFGALHVAVVRMIERRAGE